MIVLKYTISPHFCLSLVHRGLFYGIESQIRHVSRRLTRRRAFHCLPRVQFSRYSFPLDIPIYGKGDPRAPYSLCLWKDSNSVAFLTSQWSKHLHKRKLGVLLSSGFANNDSLSRNRLFVDERYRISKFTEIMPRKRRREEPLILFL